MVINTDSRPAEGGRKVASTQGPVTSTVRTGIEAVTSMPVVPACTCCAPADREAGSATRRRSAVIFGVAPALSVPIGTSTPADPAA